MNKTELRKEFDTFMSSYHFCCRCSHGVTSVGDTQHIEHITQNLWRVEFKSLTKDKVIIETFNYVDNRMRKEPKYKETIFKYEALEVLFPKILDFLIKEYKWTFEIKYDPKMDSKLQRENA